MTTRKEYEAACNELLGKLECPTHKTTVDPTQVHHQWVKNEHMYMPMMRRGVPDRPVPARNSMR